MRFTTLISGWGLTLEVHTISRAIFIGALHESEHFVSIYRFLQKAKWAPNQVAIEEFRMIADTLLPGVTESELVPITGRVRMDAALCGVAPQNPTSKREGSFLRRF
jgi:hypothetical protein